MEVNKKNIKQYLLGKLDEQGQKDFEKSIENREDIKQFIQKTKIASEEIDVFVEDLEFLQDDTKQEKWSSLQAKLDKPESKVISLKSRKTLSIAASVVILISFAILWIYTKNQNTSNNLTENTNNKNQEVSIKDTTKKVKKNTSEKRDSTKKKKKIKKSKTLLFNKSDRIVQNLKSIVPKDELSVEIGNIGFASGNEYLDTLKLALQFYNTQNYVGAIEQFEIYQTKLAKEDDKDFEANYYLAIAYLQNKQYQKAKIILEELYNLEGFLEDKNTWKPNILYALANLYLLENQKEKAKEILNKVVSPVYRKNIEEIIKNE